MGRAGSRVSPAFADRRGRCCTSPGHVDFPPRERVGGRVQKLTSWIVARLFRRKGALSGTSQNVTIEFMRSCEMCAQELTFYKVSRSPCRASRTRQARQRLVASWPRARRRAEASSSRVAAELYLTVDSVLSSRPIRCELPARSSSRGGSAAMERGRCRPSRGGTSSGRPNLLSGVMGAEYRGKCGGFLRGIVTEDRDSARPFVHAVRVFACGLPPH